MLTILFLVLTKNISACDLSITTTQDIQSSLNAIGPNSTLCLSAGTFNLNSTISLNLGQRLTGVNGVVTALQTTIVSSADRIIRMNDESQVDHLNIRSSSGSLATYAVLSYFDVNPTMWSLNIQNTKIALGIKGSSGASILNNWISLTGDLNNGIPDPSIWISDAVNTKLWYGYIVGRNNGAAGPQGFLIGDGEVGCYNSNGLTVTGTRHDYSGTSSFYLVNCDNAVLDNVSVFYSNGFGLDIVDGTDNLVIKNTKVYHSRLAASIYDEVENSNGSYLNNTFYNNNTTNQSNCAGISVAGNPANLNLSGNNVTPSPEFCLH